MEVQGARLDMSKCLEEVLQNRKPRLEHLWIKLAAPPATNVMDKAICKLQGDWDNLNSWQINVDRDIVHFPFSGMREVGRGAGN